MNLVKDQEKAAKRRILSISAVPSGQYRLSLQVDEKSELKAGANACGVFALMSDGTVELFSTESGEWIQLPPIPKREPNETL